MHFPGTEYDQLHGQGQYLGHAFENDIETFLFHHAADHANQGNTGIDGQAKVFLQGCFILGLLVNTGLVVAGLKMRVSCGIPNNVIDTV